MKIFKKKSLLLALVTILILFSFSACKDKQSNLSNAEMKILNTQYDSLNQDQKDKIPTLVQDMNLHDWEKYGDKLKKLYEDKNISDLEKAGSKHPDEDKKIGDEEYEEDKKEAIAKLKGKSVDDNETTVSTDSSPSTSTTEQADSSTSSTTTNNTPSNQRQAQGKATDLGAGTFTVGKDIPEGLYDATPADGQGNFIITNAKSMDLNVNSILGVANGIGVSKVRVKLVGNEQIKLESINKTHFEPVTSQLITDHNATSLYSGRFIVGEDIGKGRYTATSTGGTGNFIIYNKSNVPKTNEILGDSGVKQVTVNLDNGDIVTISALNQVNFAPTN